MKSYDNLFSTKVVEQPQVDETDSKYKDFLKKDYGNRKMEYKWEKYVRKSDS